MSSQRSWGRDGVRSRAMAQAFDPGGRSPQSLATSESHEARSAFTLASVAGTDWSASSQVDGVKRSVAALASAHAADLSPLPAQIFSCQAPHGPLGAALPDAAGADSARSFALACASCPNQPPAAPKHAAPTPIATRRPSGARAAVASARRPRVLPRPASAGRAERAGRRGSRSSASSCSAEVVASSAVSSWGAFSSLTARTLEGLHRAGYVLLRPRAGYHTHPRCRTRF